LLGQPPLRDYLDFVRTKCADDGDVDPATLTDEWRRANEYYQELEDTESGIADRAEIRELDPELAPLAAQVLDDPWCRETFDTIRPTIEVVELDLLIAYQKCVTWTFVERMKQQDVSTPEALFRFCLPTGARETPVSIRRAGPRRYVFQSDSMDLRYHSTDVLMPGEVRDHDSYGPVAGVVGITVGFGANLLNVIRTDKRLLLHDGYHRACALRAMGITHAPAIVQTVTTADELEVTARAVVASDPDFYFRSARPPLLKDFFDPRIRRVLRTPKMMRVIEVTYEVREFTLLE